MKKLLLTILSVGLAASLLHAITPMNITGVYKTSSGLLQGKHTTTVRIVHGGALTEVFKEIHTDLLYTDGKFSVLVGSVSSLTDSHIDHNNLKIGIQPEGLTEIFVDKYSVPEAIIAHRARFADTALGGVPPGTVISFAGVTVPTGYLECDGSAVSRTTYASLYAAISTIYGNGDGSTTFNLPDYRGRFLRGYDNSSGTDPDASSRTDRGDGTTGDAVGTKQGDATAVKGLSDSGHAHSGSTNSTGSHTHSATTKSNGFGSGAFYGSFNSGSTGSASTNSEGDHTHTVSVSNSSANLTSSDSETRSKNISVMYIIKY